MSEDEGITVKKSENFSEWYNQVALRAELADFSPVKGCMVIRPYGYQLWEKIKGFLDKRIQETGHKNAYFPIFIPENLLQKEADHVEGFSPEVAWVTLGGNTPLEEKLAVRPTSETIMYTMYSKWVRSYRDLPLLINQWANVIRWETKMTKLFMRTREFLWQEGHTVHATCEEADVEVKKMLDIYGEVYEDLLAIPVIKGKKTDKEKFAGALYTTTVELLMPDLKAVQGGTSHNLGQHFSKVFDIMFTDRDEEKKYAWQTSWGLTTRTIATLIMMHGDDKGLVLPPAVAPIDAVIVPIIFKKGKEKVMAAAGELYDKLACDFTLELDDREGYSAGYKFNHWELRGVPVRIEVGPRDVDNEQCVFVRRDTGEKRMVPIADISSELTATLATIQKDMLARAREFLETNTHTLDDYDEFMDAMNNGGGMIKVNWCGHQDCEDAIKDETGATSACIPFDEKAQGTCIYCGKPATEVVYFAKHY